MTIGTYRVLEKLGEGGMGAVYLGEHSLLGRRAAIKVLHPMFTARPDIVERFFNEARAATSINDPGIVQIFDFGFHDGMAYIVMEHLVGETLQTRGRRIKRFPEAEVLRHVRQIALSLHAAHARGVIHRDLKPDNIYVVPDPEAAGGERTKILDFGIAKLADTTDRNLTQTGLVLGTPSYMSPEQCRGAGTVDHRSDIYSLGCMMFRMLTGRPLFEAEGSGDLIACHLREPPRAPSAVIPVRPEIDAIVLRCLAKNPDERYQSMHDLATEVDQLLRNISVPPGVNLSALTPLPPAAIPPPTMATPITNLRAEIPTTLSSGVGQQAAALPPPTMSGTRHWPIIGALAVVLIAGGAIAIIAATHGRGGTEEHAASSPAPTAAAPAPTPAAPTPAPTPTAPTPTAPTPTPPPTVPSTPTPTPTATTTPTTPAADTGSATIANAGSATTPKPKKPPKKKPTSTSSSSDMYDDR